MIRLNGVGDNVGNEALLNCPDDVVNGGEIQERQAGLDTAYPLRVCIFDMKSTSGKLWKAGSIYGVTQSCDTKLDA